MLISQIIVILFEENEYIVKIFSYISILIFIINVLHFCYHVYNILHKNNQEIYKEK